MSMHRRTMLGAASLGAAAGAVGTLAMDLVWYGRHKSQGGESRFTEFEFSAGTEGYEQAGAPAQVGKRVTQAVAGQAPPPERAGLTTDVVHWLTGVGWGSLHGLAAASQRAPVAVLGPVTGAVAWTTAYAVLAPAGLYKPMWEYEPQTLWKDLSAHLVFGTATAVIFRALAGSR